MRKIILEIPVKMAIQTLQDAELKIDLMQDLPEIPKLYFSRFSDFVSAEAKIQNLKPAEAEGEGRRKAAEGKRVLKRERFQKNNK